MKKITIALYLLVAIAGKGQTKDTRTIPAIFLCSDTTCWNGIIGVYHPPSFHLRGFVVQQIHSTAEGIMDAGAAICLGPDGNEKPCYTNYWVTVKRMGADKKPLPAGLIIWQTLELP